MLLLFITHQLPPCVRHVGLLTLLSLLLTLLVTSVTVLQMGLVKLNSDEIQPSGSYFIDTSTGPTDQSFNEKTTIRTQRSTDVSEEMFATLNIQIDPPEDVLKSVSFSKEIDATIIPLDRLGTTETSISKRSIKLDNFLTTSSDDTLLTPGEFLTDDFSSVPTSVSTSPSLSLQFPNDISTTTENSEAMAKTLVDRVSSEAPLQTTTCADLPSEGSAAAASLQTEDGNINKDVCVLKLIK